MGSQGMRLPAGRTQVRVIDTLTQLPSTLEYRTVTAETRARRLDARVRGPRAKSLRAFRNNEDIVRDFKRRGEPDHPRYARIRCGLMKVDHRPPHAAPSTPTTTRGRPAARTRRRTRGPYRAARGRHKRDAARECWCAGRRQRPPRPRKPADPRPAAHQSIEAALCHSQRAPTPHTPL